MRNFRFRLDPVMRLKEYHIERKEEEIAKIEQQIQNLQQEIERGRAAVQAFRQHVLEEVEDRDLLDAERRLDLFSQFTFKEERRINEEISKQEQEKAEKRQELIQLYQDKKALERLKERRRTEWEKEMRLEENAVMDEIGTQKYIRRNREFGGVILYLIVPIALAAAAAAVGIATGVIDQSLLNKLPFFGESPKSATETIQSATAPLEEEFITLENLIGDSDTPMPELLKNIADMRQQMRQERTRLKEWEDRLNQKQATIEQQQNSLADLTKQASEYLIAYEDMKRQLEQTQKSELSQYEQDISTTLSSAKGKEIAPIATNLYDPPTERTEERRLQAEQRILENTATQLSAQEQQVLNTQSVDEALLADVREQIRVNQEQLQSNQDNLDAVREKIRDSQLLLLKILHNFPPRGRKELFTALAKASPDVASRIVADYMTTTTNELNKIQPTPTPLPSIDDIDGGTSPPGAE